MIILFRESLSIIPCKENIKNLIKNCCAKDYVKSLLLEITVQFLSSIVKELLVIDVQKFL